MYKSLKGYINKYKESSTDNSNLNIYNSNLYSQRFPKNLGQKLFIIKTREEEVIDPNTLNLTLPTKAINKSLNIQDKNSIYNIILDWE